MLSTANGVIIAVNKSLIPESLRPALRDFLDSCAQAADRLSLRRDLVPPGRLNRSGEGDFKETGREFLHYFRELAALRPEEAVLDVGCGVGRMAVALTE